MNTIGSGLPALFGGAARPTPSRTAAEGLSSAAALRDEQAPASAPAAFDFRHMSSDKLQSSMAAITKAGHLTPDQQMMLHTSFTYDRLTAVGPYLPEKAAEPKDILAGLNSGIEGDLSRGDQQGAARMKQILSILTNLQTGDQPQT